MEDDFVDDWLCNSFVNQGKLLVRRQDLPKDAILPADDAMNCLDRFQAAGVISHGWLKQGHPDPDGKRKSDVRAIDNRISLFWDFLSICHFLKRAILSRPSLLQHFNIPITPLPLLSLKINPIYRYQLTLKIVNLLLSCHGTFTPEQMTL